MVVVMIVVVVVAVGVGVGVVDVVVVVVVVGVAVVVDFHNNFINLYDKKHTNNSSSSSITHQRHFPPASRASAPACISFSGSGYGMDQRCQEGMERMTCDA